MCDENLPALCIEVFLANYQKLHTDEDSLIRENCIQPVKTIPTLDTLPDYSEKGKSLLKEAVAIKLNGGLGTGMGLKKAKSLLTAKDDQTFLELIIKQVLSQRQHFASDLPLVFMNSFSTETDTLNVLHKYPEVFTGQKNIPLSFIQNKVPKILADNLQPAQWPEDSSKTWCPPGHGDIYTALQTSGILDTLLDQGIKYAFISNSDNLGGSLDLSILGYFAVQDASFMMEVADRTEADKKGGHLAETREGGLLLREAAQCHDDDISDFQNISKYRYFNTNNLWIRLDRLKQHLDEHHGIVDLPLIQNKKTLDPRESDSPQVIQLETAMGSAISLFEDAIALRIPKKRFAPIKTTNELLGLWSNAFVLDDNNLVISNPARDLGFIVIDLDKRYYKNIDDLSQRFPEGAPDMLECSKLVIQGDVKFGCDIKLIGHVEIINGSDQQMFIESGSTISEDVIA